MLCQKARVFATVGLILSLVSVVPAIAAPQPQATGITNGDFEAGAVGWQVDRATIGTTFPAPVQPHSGTYALTLSDKNGGSNAAQTFTVPVATPYMIYWAWVVSSEELCSLEYEGINIGLVNIVQPDNLNICTTSATGGWVRRVVDLRAAAGKQVALQFLFATTDPAENSTLYIDDVTLAANPGTTTRVFVPLIDAPPATPFPSNIRNGDFEQGRTIWREYASDNKALIVTTPSGVTPNSGTWVARLATGQPGLQYLSQQVTLPASGAYELAYVYQIKSIDACSQSFFGVFINDERYIARSVCGSTSTSSWRAERIDLTGFAGKTIKITFRLANTDVADTNNTLYLDDVVIQVAGVTR